MSMLQPGEHFEGTTIVSNPVFASRAPRVRTTKEQRLFSAALLAAEQADRQGFAVTAETLHMMNDQLPVRLMVELMGTERWQEACEEHGLPVASQSGLTPQQLMALRIYTDLTVPANHAARLRMIGVTDATWRGWLRQPRFAAHVSQLAEEALASRKDVALLKLAEAVDAGQRWAIEMELEMTGRHDRRKEGVDVNALLMAVFAILDEEVPDVAVLQRIGGRIRQMMGAEAAPVLTITASELRNEPTPEEGSHEG